jgi:TetR/AcrR family transcriptional regulator, regulator of autoinduction and epiphytic fitness
MLSAMTDRPISLPNTYLNEAACEVCKVMFHLICFLLELHSIQIVWYSIEMSHVKPEPKRKTLRDAHAQLTRERIANAARRLFARGGYAATTLAEIATEAGVAVQTVYAVYGSKAGILGALRESVMAQPEARAFYREAMAAPSAARCVVLFARSIRWRWERSADVTAIFRDAGTADASIRTSLAATLEQRRGGIRALAERLEAELRPGLDVAVAAAILDALSLAEVYAELVEMQGWTPDAYEAWLTGILASEVLLNAD